MFRVVAPFCILLALAGCSGARAPEQLSGLWSSGQAACEAGVGVRFGANAIEAVYDQRAVALFKHPRYRLERSGGEPRIRITYDLPYLPGGVRSAGAHGVVILVRRDDGGIEPASHQMVDPRTGAVRVRVQNDPVRDLLSLQPCGPSPWRSELRGRTDGA